MTSKTHRICELTFEVELIALENAGIDQNCLKKLDVDGEGLIYFVIDEYDFYPGQNATHFEEGYDDSYDLVEYHLENIGPTKLFKVTDELYDVISEILSEQIHDAVLDDYYEFMSRDKVEW